MNEPILQDLRDFRKRLKENGEARGKILEELESKNNPKQKARRKLGYRRKILKSEQLHLLCCIQICKESLEVEKK